MKTNIEVNIKEDDNSLVYSFTGELDETNADSTFEPIDKALKEYNSKKVIFDFKTLKYINSKTIGYLIDIFSNIEDAGGEMFIRNCNGGIRDTLNFTGVDTIIPYIDEKNNTKK